MTDRLINEFYDRIIQRNLEADIISDSDAAEGANFIDELGKPVKVNVKDWLTSGENADTVKDWI